MKNVGNKFLKFNELNFFYKKCWEVTPKIILSIVLYFNHILLYIGVLEYEHQQI